MAFDITSVLKGAAGTAGEEQIVYLPLDDLDPDPNNFYSLDGINDLAGNIELVGLQQPLRVRPGEEPGRYTVVSGHRRRAALQLIRDGYDSESAGRARWEKAACIVDYGKASAAMKELQLIYANASTRQPSAPELSRQAERVTELLYQLKEEGHSFPGRMRDHVAAACQVSKTKLARLHAIRANLVPDLLEEFDDGRLNESVAYRISQEKAAVQRELAKRTGPSIRDYDINRTEAAIAQVKEPKPAAPEWEQSNEAALSYIEERERDLRELRKIIRENLHSILDALTWSRFDGYDLSEHYRQENITKCRTFGRTSYACGFNCRAGSIEWNSSRVRVVVQGRELKMSWPEFYDELSSAALQQVRTAEKPKVSKTDTKPKWQTGTPTEVGYYMTRVGAGSTDSAKTGVWQMLHWNGSAWTYNAVGKQISAWMNVFCWVPLPDPPEEE